MALVIHLPYGAAGTHEELKWSKERVKIIRLVLSRRPYNSLKEFPPSEIYRAHISCRIPRLLLEQKIEQLRDEKLRDRMRQTWQKNV